MSFIITLSVLIAVMAVAGGVYASIRSLMRPPTIPTHVQVTRPVTPSGSGGQTQSAGTNAPASAPSVDIELPPDIIGVFERKPMFYTFLLFGLNQYNADVIIVGAIDTVAEQLHLISVPRDTLIDTDRRIRKPAISYSTGRVRGGTHETGVAMIIEDMQKLFGFTPDFYVSVDEQAFIRVVDSVGGVQVNVPFHMRYDDPVQNLSINLSPGTQTLNGRQAMHFVRYRMGNPGYRTITDYQRIEHQQQVISALFAELMSPRTIVRIPELVGIYRDYVNTDMTIGEQLWFLEQVNRLRGTTLNAYTLPTTGTSGSPSWYELPDKDAILELINRTVNPFVEDITEEMVRIINE